MTWIKAVAHVHSTWSYDGSWELPELSAKFASRGCRALLMTEHDLGFTQARFDEFRDACARASSEQILVVPGIEYSDAANCVHILVWGLNRFLGEALPTLEMLRAAREAGGFAVLAHPARRQAGQRVEPEWLELLNGIECWNRKYDGWAASGAASGLLDQSERIPFVGLDFHTVRQLFPLSMAIDVTGDLSEDAIVDAMREGRCEARAFGRAVNGVALRLAGGALAVAERGRRMAARTARSLGVFRTAPVNKV